MSLEQAMSTIIRSHDERTTPHRDARQTGQVSLDITSLTKRQKNDLNLNDQIFFNIDPTQKYTSELAEGFQLKEISIEHFTIPD